MPFYSRKSAAGAAALALALLVHASATGAPPSTRSAAGASNNDLFREIRWRLIGPFRGGWAEMIVGVPARPDTFYFGAAGGGVWRTDDAGLSWRSLFDAGPTAPIGAIALAPSDPQTLYIGAGQPEPRYDVAGGTGVFRSGDGGRTWRALGLEKTRHIGRIWIDPGNRDIVLVAAVGDFFGAGPDRGVFRSVDGGTTWTRTLDLGPQTGAVDLASDPADPNTVFAAAWQARQWPWQSYFTPIQGPGSGLYKSADGGRTWARLGGAGWPAGPLGRISLAATRTARGLRLYAVVESEAMGGLYRSDDGGGAWIRVNDEPAFSGFYASRVTVAPDDPDVVYLVGQSMRRCDHGGSVCTIVKGAPGGDDYHQVWINPDHPDHMAAASDQGATISIDGGASWSSWYNQPTGQFYHLATDNVFPYRIYAGQQDLGPLRIASRSDFGSISFRDWTPIGGEERDYDIPDPDDPTVVYASGLGGRISRWDTISGQSANIAPYLEPNYGERQTTTAHRFVWVTPMAVSQAGPTTLYLGGEVVFASTDRGTRWSVISPDLTGKNAKANACDGDVAVADAKACGYGGIWSLAPSPRRAGELWVGTDDGLVQLTRDGGAHWINVTPSGLPEWAKVAAIDPSPLSDGGAYIAVDNHRQGDLRPRIWKTGDWGANWSDITGDLPRDHFVSVVRADPVRPGLLYAGTEAGLYVSLNDGGHWSPLMAGLPTAWVRDLLVHGDDLIAATQGRGLWILDDISPLRQVSAKALADPVHLFAPADAVRLRPNANQSSTPMPPEEPAGANPPGGAVIDYWLAKPASGPVTIEIHDRAGVVVRRLASEAEPLPPAERYFAAAWLHPPPPLSRQAGLHRAVWDLRLPRPAAIAYVYSQATVAGGDTPVAPEGPLALPGNYQVTLTVDGHVQQTSLHVVQDPRSRATPADLAASLALSEQIGAKLAVARRGYGEQQAVRRQLEAIGPKIRENSAVSTQLADLLAQTPAAGAKSGFSQASTVLTNIEIDLEAGDLAPTDPQRRTVEQMGHEIDAAWTAWSKLRETALPSLNAALTRSGSKPVSIPSEDKLVIVPPAGGEDLP